MGREQDDALGIGRLAVIPLVFTMSSRATRRGRVAYRPVPIGWTWAMLAEPA